MALALRTAGVLAIGGGLLLSVLGAWSLRGAKEKLDDFLDGDLAGCAETCAQLGEQVPAEHHDWAGHYMLLRFAFGTCIRLEPEGTFTACLGARHVSGRVVVTEGSVELSSWSFARFASGHWRGLPRFELVRWGTERLLVREEHALAFCNAVNSDWPAEPIETGAFRRLTPAGERAGLPEVPPAWRPYLLSEPVTGRVRDVEEMGEVRRLHLDAGREAGLLLGMTVHAEPVDWPRDAWPRWGVATVVESWPGGSVAECSRCEAAAGWLFSTRHPRVARLGQRGW